MKRKFEKKLALNKQTIARLNSEEMIGAQGGTLTPLTPLIDASIAYCEFIFHTILSVVESCLPAGTCNGGGGGGRGASADMLNSCGGIGAFCAP